MANPIVDLHQIGIIGTGEFGLAIGKRLLRAGYNVIYGSRRPENRNLAKRDAIYAGVDVESIEECIKTSTMLVFAIHKKHFNTLLEYQNILSGKVVIDVSNQDKRDRNESNAEYLASMFPQTCFVKAFNVISAYNMENIGYCTEEKRVYVASDNPDVRHVICEMVKLLGFVPVDMGRLRMSRGIEKMPIRLFSGWGGSVLITLLIFVVWLIYAVFKFYVRTKSFDSAQFPLKVLNKPICITAITLLAITYLPSSVAGFTQIYYGTRHKRFPRWLDKWLKARKSLGIIALFLIFIHVIMSILIMGPTYFREFYSVKPVVLPTAEKSELLLFQPAWMLWQAETALLIGISALVLLLWVGLSAIPSVAHTLNWREWRFIQSGCGHFALVLCIAHVIFIGLPRWAEVTHPSHVLDSLAFLAIVIPVITLIIKLFMFCPCVSRHLRKIRQGYDREDPIDTKEKEKRPHGPRKFRRKKKTKERDVFTHPPVADLQDIP